MSLKVKVAGAWVIVALTVAGFLSGGPVVQVPGTINATCSSDVTTELDSFVEGQADGTTIEFPTDACYRVDGTLEWTKNNITLDGNNSTIRATTAGAGDRAHIRFTGGSNWACDDLDVEGVNASPGTLTSSMQYQHGFAFLGVDNATLNGCETISTYGDGYYVGKNPGNGVASSDIQIINGRSEDAGRNALAVVAGTNITLQGGYFDFAGLNLFNVEPNNGNTVNGVDINGVTVGPWPTRQWQVTCTGPPDPVNPRTATVSNVQLRNSSFVGSPLTARCDMNEATNQTVMRASNFSVTNNTSNTQYTGPVASVIAYHVDGFTATGNTQTFSGGQNFAYACDSTNVSVSGNTYTGATLQLATAATCGDEPVVSASSANIFVESGAGACTTASATEIEYSASASPDRRCGTLDAAWDNMSAGQTARIRPGTYSGQLVTGNKTSDTKMIGDAGVTFVGPAADPNNPCPNAPGTDPYQTGIMCITANFFWLENVTIDQEDTVQTATGIGQANGADITFKDVNFHGERPSFQAQGDRFHWNGGDIGESGQPAGQRWCGDGNPMTLNGSDVLIENITIYPQGSDQTPWAPGGPCGSGESSNGFHLELIRNEGASGTIRKNDFKAGSEAGSGLIFWTGADTGNWTIEGNYFGQVSDGSTSYQINATVATCNWTWRYNTLMQGNDTPCTDSSSVWVGNLGNVGCSGTHTKNVQQRGSACGTDTIVAGTAGGTENLDINADGSLQSDSEAINAGEATCSTVTPDFLGTTRPSGGSNCDAGAVEYAGG